MADNDPQGPAAAEAFVASAALIAALLRTIFIIVIIGRTGDGKSSFGNLLVALLGHDGPAPFSEGAGANAHTADPSWAEVGDTLIIDLPGLCDTNGLDRDEANIRKIVAFLRAIGRVNMFVHLVNETAPRYDAGMQNATKLMIDSFGPRMLASHSCIVYSRADGRKTREFARTRTDEIAELIATRAGIPLPHLPCYQIEAHPEEMAGMGVPAERIAALRASVAETVRGDFMRLVRTTVPALVTTTAVFGEYDDHRARREAEERAVEEKRRREYEASVVETINERRDNVEYRTATHQSTGHYVNRIFGKEWKDTGVCTTRYLRSETRTIKVYGSGVRETSEWVAVPGTEHTA